tara:strand:- start:3946 stop:4266 length:321 start_codon:yes stop_codon:yes gene_type:complete
MNRYIGKKGKREDVHASSDHFNKPMHLTTVLPRIDRKHIDKIIIATSTDRLDQLADKFYGDQRKWWIIALANNLPGDSLFIEPGKQLFIPTDISAIKNNMKKINGF